MEQRGKPVGLQLLRQEMLAVWSSDSGKSGKKRSYARCSLKVEYDFLVVG